MSRAIVHGPQSRAHLLWYLLSGDRDLRPLHLELDRIVGHRERLDLRVRGRDGVHDVVRGPDWGTRPLDDLVSSVKEELLRSMREA